MRKLKRILIDKRNVKPLCKTTNYQLAIGKTFPSYLSHIKKSIYGVVISQLMADFNYQLQL